MTSARKALAASEGILISLVLARVLLVQCAVSIGVGSRASS